MLTHASRQLRSWLIFNVSRKMTFIRKHIVGFLLGTFCVLVLAEVFPVFTIGFWRIAYASECAIGFVGPGGSPAPDSLISDRIGAAPTASLSYRLLYMIGNAQGKSYAIMGLRFVDWEEYVRLRDDFALSSAKVRVHSGCTVSESTAEAAVLFYEVVYCSESRREEKLKELRAHFDQLRKERGKR